MGGVLLDLSGGQTAWTWSITSMEDGARYCGFGIADFGFQNAKFATETRISIKN